MEPREIISRELLKSPLDHKSKYFLIEKTRPDRSLLWSILMGLSKASRRLISKSLLRLRAIKMRGKMLEII